MFETGFATSVMPGAGRDGPFSVCGSPIEFYCYNLLNAAVGDVRLWWGDGNLGARIVLYLSPPPAFPFLGV